MKLIESRGFAFYPTQHGDLPCVAVLMSTFNGNEFLNSVFNKVTQQKHVCVHLFVRDDGSEDETGQFFIQHSGEYFHTAKNRLGSSKSYFELMRNIPLDSFNYFAFCDQDDEWDQDHLINSIIALQGSDSKVCYTSPRIRSGDNMWSERLKLSSLPFSPFFQHPFHGSGYVFDASALLFLITLDEEQIIQHDFALYIYARLMNVLVFLEKPDWNYVIHSSNETGFPSFSVRLRVVNSIGAWTHARLEQAEHILRILSKESCKSDEKYSVKGTLLTFKAIDLRLSSALRREFRRNLFENIVVLISIWLIGSYKKIRRRFSQTF